MTKERNILVVGAGPAGCSAAYFLKKIDLENNLNVDLVEKNTNTKYDQYHSMCGEAVHSNIIDDLRDIKLKGIGSKISEIEEHYPENIKIKSYIDGLLINRSLMFKSIIDEYEKLGGIFFHETVKKFHQGKNKIETQFKNKSKAYDYIIAADGANSLFRKNLNIPGNTKVLVQYIINEPIEKQSLNFFYDEKFLGDYKWEFPYNDIKKIGWPLGIRNVKKPMGKIIKKQARMVGFGGLDRYVFKNILLVGDAACQTNPLTKGGIRSAVAAGKMAAEALYIDKPDKYEDSWNRSPFSSKLFITAYNQLKNMDNEELAYHIKPFDRLQNNKYFSKIKLNTKLMIHYTKYLDIYKAYELSNEYGW